MKNLHLTRILAYSLEISFAFLQIFTEDIFKYQYHRENQGFDTDTESSAALRPM